MGKGQETAGATAIVHQQAAEPLRYTAYLLPDLATTTTPTLLGLAALAPLRILCRFPLPPSLRESPQPPEESF